MKMISIEELNFSLGKSRAPEGFGIWDIKEINSLNGIRDKEMIINILKEVPFGAFDNFGLITNKITGNFLKVEPMANVMEQYLAKKYFYDVDENDMSDEKTAKEIDYNCFDLYAITNGEEVLGILIRGNESREENMIGYPELRIAIYHMKELNGMQVSLIQYLKDEYFSN